MVVSPDKIPAGAPILDIHTVRLTQLKKFLSDDFVQVVIVVGRPEALQAVIYTYPGNTLPV